MGFEAAVVGLPGNSYAFTNCVYLHLEDFMSLVKQVPKGLVAKEELRAHGLNVWLNRKFVMAAKPHKEVEAGTIAVGTMQRMCVGLPMNEACEISVYAPSGASKGVLSTVTFEIQQVLTRAQGNELRVIDCNLLKDIFEAEYTHQVFAVGQLMAVRCDGLPLRLQCVNVDTVDGDDCSPGSFNSRLGVYLHGAIVIFTKGKDAPVRLTNQSSGTTRTVFKPDFDFTKLGIGGLDKEFNDIFRRAFASRLFPTDVIQKLGIQHVRGMLLFGPPGCGKTLIARKISQALTAKEPKVVNGPEILDKFVGESERKIRELFADARKDQEELGDESDVHIIIFDEIDAICKQRGSSRDSTGVGDSVVNQLLTQIDGVDSLNNVLVIGMTNRKDMLDEALMRPGRLEVQIEINLPDEKGRAQILKIHTDRAREKGALHPKVIADLDNCLDPTKFVSDDPEYKNLVQRTKNFSGAEIEGLVRAATAHALSRGTDGRTMHAIANYNPEISMEDFALALEEVKPKFGAPSDQLALYYKNGLIPYGDSFADVREGLTRVIDQVRSNDKTPLMSVLLHGERGAGKTALATYCAVASEFPLVRMVKASELISRAESGKCSYIYNVFEEAYRSPLSIIILDDIERLIDYVGMGPRFSNLVLQALMVLVRNPVPVAGRKLVVIGITSNVVALQGVELSDVFDLNLEVPQLTQKDELEVVLTHTGLPIVQAQMDQVLTLLSDRPISIKKLLLVTEMAKEELNRSGESHITVQQLIELINKIPSDVEMAKKSKSKIKTSTPLTEKPVDGVSDQMTQSTEEQSITKEERRRVSEKIDHLLEARPDPEDLEQRNVLPVASPTVASTLVGVQMELKRRLSADELAHRLENRPNVQELRDHSIVHCNDTVAPSLQATQDKLERQLKSDKVHQHLTNRPSIGELRTTGVLETSAELAPSLTATAKKLERNLVQNQVSHLLEARPEKDELVSHNIIEGQTGTVAPVLQGPKHQLERQLKVDQISRQLRGRPSVTELEENGILDEGELGDDGVQKKHSLSQRARYALALKAASRIAADKLITAEEKTRLKDLILSDNEKVVAALECYELDGDIQEMLETLYHVAKVLS